MRLFSKLVFICNICFLLAVALRLIELAKRSKGNYDTAIALQPLESTFIILGYGAIFINIVFFVLSIYWIANKKINLLPGWLVLINLILFPVQVWYFFFSNI